MILWHCQSKPDSVIRLPFVTDNLMIKYIQIFIFLFSGLLACSQDNVVNQNLVKDQVDIKTVVILGNSIVKHSPKPDIGWTGNWGMAASVEDSDFVHLLIRDIKRLKPTAVVKYLNIADFERNYKTYTLSNLSDMKDPDLLIVKLSENVDDNSAQNEDFIFYYDQLLGYIAPSKITVKVILDGFWQKPNVNSLVKDYAQKNNYLFVKISDLSADVTNSAKGLFGNDGVASHPSDKGMRLIEQRIWSTVRDYFINN